jgi:hypothetical protein
VLSKYNPGRERAALQVAYRVESREKRIESRDWQAGL